MRPPSICLVASVDGELATTLAKAGWRVHVLSIDPGLGHIASLAEPGIGVTYVADLVVPPVLTLGGPNIFPLLHQSDQVRFALADLHRVHRFDIIHFADGVGLGFRSIQAKRLGLDFTDVEFFVVAKEPGQES